MTRPHGGTLYLHIGLPKTGTTYLQREILPRIRSLHSLSLPKSDIVERAYPWHSGMRAFFDRSPHIWGALGSSLFEEILGRRDSQLPDRALISDENLSISMRYPSRLEGPDRARFGFLPHSVGEHLRALRPVAAEHGFRRLRVLLTIRRQDTWLGSAYAQFSNRWKGASQEHFEDWVASLLDPRRDYWLNGVCLDFHVLRAELVEAVGTDNVLILPHELMRENLSGFLTRWFRFLEVPEAVSDVLAAASGSSGHNRANVRSREPNVWAVRSRTTAWSRTVSLRPRRLFAALRLPRKIGLRWPDLHRDHYIRVTPALRTQILGTYSKPNALVAEFVPVDLSRYGYIQGAVPGGSDTPG